MKIRLLKIAQQELDEAVEWYNQQAVGLGLEFLDEFDDSVKLVASFPEISEKIIGLIDYKNQPQISLTRFYT